MNRFTVIANNKQLESIGIDYKLTGLTGTVLKTYDDDYVQIEITHIWEGIEFTNNFDIPRYWLELENK